MIIDLEKFIASEQPYWDELDQLLAILEERTGNPLPLEKVKRFNYLYQRTASDLARISTFSAEPTTRRYLENLVARAYAEVHEVRMELRASLELRIAKLEAAVLVVGGLAVNLAGGRRP